MPRGSPLWKRLVWFAVLWVAGVASIAGVSYAIRFWLSA